MFSKDIVVDFFLSFFFPLKSSIQSVPLKFSDEEAETKKENESKREEAGESTLLPRDRQCTYVV